MSSDLHKESVPKRVLELQAEFIKDTQINEVNLKEKALATPGIKAKWNLCHKSELSYLNKLEALKEKLIDDYTKSFGKPGIPKLVTEREALSENGNNLGTR
jgi:hypothetical protein